MPSGPRVVKGIGETHNAECAGCRERTDESTHSIVLTHPAHARSAPASKPGRTRATDRQRPPLAAAARLRRGRNAELLGQLDAAALRTARHVARRTDQGLKRVVARRTTIFIDRHRWVPTSRQRASPAIAGRFFLYCGTRKPGLSIEPASRIPTAIDRGWASSHNPDRPIPPRRDGTTSRFQSFPGSQSKGVGPCRSFLPWSWRRYARTRRRAARQQISRHGGLKGKQRRAAR